MSAGGLPYPGALLQGSVPCLCYCLFVLLCHSHANAKTRSRIAMKPQFGSDLIVDIFKHYEIEYAALNPGSTFRALHDSMVNYGANRLPEMITCSHEEIAVGIAHGYAKATGKPMLAIVPNVVGLLA